MRFVQERTTSMLLPLRKKQQAPPTSVSLTRTFTKSASCGMWKLPSLETKAATIAGRRIAPAQTVSDDKDDAADHPPIVNPRNPVRQWKIRLDPAHLRLRQQQQISHGDAPRHRH